jgi:hypothetical protein
MAGLAYPIAYRHGTLHFVTETWVQFLDRKGEVHNVIVGDAGTTGTSTIHSDDGKAELTPTYAWNGVKQEYLVTVNDSMVCDALSHVTGLYADIRLPGGAHVDALIVAQVLLIARAADASVTVRMARDGKVSPYSVPNPKAAALDRVMDTRLTMGEWELMKEQVPTLWDVLADLANHPEVTA